MLTVFLLPVVRYVGRAAGLPEMLHYVTGAPRIVPVCPARHWGECDVQNLTAIGPNPEETGALLFSPCQAHPATHTHVQMHRRVHTWNRLRFSPLPLFKMPPEKTLGADLRPAIPIRDGLWRNATVMKGSGFQMFSSPLYCTCRKWNAKLSVVCTFESMTANVFLDIAYVLHIVIGLVRENIWGN